MIKNITLSGFKSISREDPIELKNFSMLCGSNSSGKSSFIQSILMLSQTFGSRYDQDSIVLNGHLVRLGSFRDIKTHSEGSGTIDIGFTINGPLNHYGLPGAKTIKFQINFGYPRIMSRVSYSEANFHPPINGIKITLVRQVDGVEKTEELSLKIPKKNRSENGQFASPMREFFNVEECTLPEMDEIGKEFPGYNILGCERGSATPSTIYIEYDHTRKMSSYIIGLISESINTKSDFFDDDTFQDNILIPEIFFNTLKECISIEFEKVFQIIADDFPKNLPKDLAKRIKSLYATNSQFRLNLAKTQINIDQKNIDSFLKKNKSVKLSDWFLFLKSCSQKERKSLTELIDKHRALLQDAWYQGTKPEMREVQVTLRTMHYLSSYLSSYFSRSVKYLGPLRNEPQAVYSALGHNEPSQIGLKGEFTAAALHINRNKSISYLSPTTGTGDQISLTPKQATLSIACQEWLTYLGVLVEYSTNDRGKLGYEINVKTTKDEPWQDLTHVGVGVSQVLPIVLMALLSENDDLLIFEQPELHLHPKIQSRLCDFFIAISSFNRQCLIETHSEYLINRLRRRIAQSRNEEILDQCSVFFVTKSNGLSNFDPVEINRYGAIQDWPEDFFDQTDMEIQKILLDAVVKRREEKKGK